MTRKIDTVGSPFGPEVIGSITSRADGSVSAGVGEETLGVVSPVAAAESHERHQLTGTLQRRTVFQSLRPGTASQYICPGR